MFTTRLTRQVVEKLEQLRLVQTVQMLLRANISQQKNRIALIMGLLSNDVGYSRTGMLLLKALRRS